MNFKNTLKSLEKLEVSLNKEFSAAKESAKKVHYKKASEKLASAIETAELKLAIIKKELTFPSSGTEQELEAKNKAQALHDKLENLLNDMKFAKSEYDDLYGDLESERLQKKYKSLDKEVNLSREYSQSYIQLENLKKQNKPLVGVKDELYLFLKKVKEIRKDESVPLSELIETMNATYDRLTGGDKDKFDAHVAKLGSKDSILLKSLGITLIALGAALVFSAIFFAPALITAASVGLGTIYAAAGATTVASSALTIAGTASFFGKTKRMELARIAQDIANEKLDDQHYDKNQPAPMGI